MFIADQYVGEMHPAFVAAAFACADRCASLDLLTCDLLTLNDFLNSFLSK
jgi:hypothetical protein